MNASLSLVISAFEVKLWAQIFIQKGIFLQKKMNKKKTIEV